MIADALDAQLVSLLEPTLSARAAPQQWFQFTESEWRGLFERAKYHGLLGLLSNLLQDAPPEILPSNIRDESEAVSRQSALAAATCYHELNQLLALWNAENIEVIVLKGAALAKWLYPAPLLRPFGDLDLLVRKTHLARIDALLRARGYAFGNVLGEAFYQEFASEQAYYRLQPPRITVDVHSELLVFYFFTQRVDNDWFWQRRQLVSFGTATAAIFSPTAQLLHLALHAGLHHRHDIRLIWLYDIALLINRHGSTMDWHSAQAFAQRAKLESPIYNILLQTQLCWKPNFPPDYPAAFAPPRHRVAERIVFALTATEQNHAIALADALSQKGFRKKLRYIRLHLFPDATYMRRHYGVENNWRMPVAYLKRLSTSAWKFLRSLWCAFTRRA